MKKGENVIEKEIDALGRVVIPQRYRERLGIKKNETVHLVLGNDNIQIKPTRPTCALCHTAKSVNASIGLCHDCIEKVKSL